MFRRKYQPRIRDTVMLSGWLFADLLLGLAMIFLASVAGGNPLVRTCSTPVASSVAAAGGTSTANLRHTLQADVSSSKWQMPSTSDFLSMAPTPTPMPCPGRTPTSTPTPMICGLDIKHLFDEVVLVDNPNGLRNGNDAAEQAFANTARTVIFASYAQQKAGYIEVFGGSDNHTDDGTGEELSAGVIASLKLLEKQSFVFSADKTYFQGAEFLGKLASNSVELFVLFYQQAANGASCT